MSSLTHETARHLPTLGQATAHLHPEGSSVEAAELGATGRSARRGRPRRRTIVGAVLLGVVIAAVASAGGAYAAANFSDVTAGHPFYDEIYWAADNGITEGYPDGTFKPANNVSRQAAAAFLSRYNEEIVTVSRNFNFGVTSAGAVTGGVTCPAGKRAIAGGGDSAAINTFVAASFPNASASQWTITVKTTSATLVSSNATVWATCIPKT